MVKTIGIVLVALVMAYGGVTLARFADDDDAPGGVVVGWVIVLGAVALGVRPFLRRQPNPE